MDGPPFMEVSKKTFSKKLSKTFGGYDKISYLASAFGNDGKQE